VSHQDIALPIPALWPPPAPSCQKSLSNLGTHTYSGEVLLPSPGC
jgi:hypothetical protein